MGAKQAKTSLAFFASRGQVTIDCSGNHFEVSPNESQTIQDFLRVQFNYTDRFVVSGFHKTPEGIRINVTRHDDVFRSPSYQSLHRW